MESQGDDKADRPRLTIEASWPSRTEPVDGVLIQAMVKFTVMTSMPVKKSQES
ncbi:hypothetical protein [Streptomyces mirabilis]